MKELEGRIQKGFVTFKLFHPKLFDAILTCRTSYVPFTTTTSDDDHLTLEEGIENCSDKLLLHLNCPFAWVEGIFSSHFVKTTTLPPHSGPENLKKPGQKNSWNQINQFHEFFLTKFHFLQLQNWPNINYWPGKKFKTAKNAISRKTIFDFIWFHEFFFLPGLF